MYTALGVQRPLLTSAQPLALSTQAPPPPQYTQEQRQARKKKRAWRQAVRGSEAQCAFIPALSICYCGHSTERTTRKIESQSWYLVSSGVINCDT